VGDHRVGTRHGGGHQHDQGHGSTGTVQGQLPDHDLGRRLFDEVQRHLAAKGLKAATGTIVDATIISAPSSTKNADKARDPEMHQTKNGNQ
jgi:hypothetical protein